MADPSYWSASSPNSRWTLADVRAFVAAHAGVGPSNLTGDEPALLLRCINAECEEWRTEFGGLRGFGERPDVNLTWVVGDTRILMPADFAEILGGRLYLRNASDAAQNPLEVTTYEAYQESIRDGESSKYDNRDVPIAFLHGMGTTGRRMLEIRPTPTTAVRIHGKYLGHLQALSVDGDLLEAPQVMHDGITAGAAVRFLEMRGQAGSEKTQSLFGRKMRLWQRLQSSSGSERKRPARFISHEEAGGYARLDPADATPS